MQDGFVAPRTPLSADGVEIRAGAIEDIPALMRIHHQGWQRAYAGFLPAERIAAMRPSPAREDFWRRAMANGEKSLRVATLRGETLGFVLGGPLLPHDLRAGSLAGCEREIYAFHVRQDAAGRGLGRHLLATIADDWRREKYAGFMLWCFAANPYRRFYEKAGGLPIAEGYDEGVADLAFAWRDLQFRMAGPAFPFLKEVS